jgi:glycosyltransferase involved in cell wall biosynthesis
VTAERLSISFCDHVIISNDIWKTKLEGRSVKPSDCTSIINYPDGSIFYKRPRTRDDGRFIMIYPGTLNWHQGLDIALRAFSLIKDQLPHAFFFIYGEGPTRAELERQIGDLNLSGRVVIKSTIPLRQIAEIIADADVGIIPKRNDSFGGEAFSTKTLEFMASGVPVIVSRTRVDRYYFNDSLVRFFEPENEADLAEGMLELALNRRARDTLARNGYEFACRNSWEVKKGMYLDLTDSLILGGKQRSQQAHAPGTSLG